MAGYAALFVSFSSLTVVAIPFVGGVLPNESLQTDGELSLAGTQSSDFALVWTPQGPASLGSPPGGYDLLIRRSTWEAGAGQAGPISVTWTRPSLASAAVEFRPGTDARWILSPIGPSRVRLDTGAKCALEPAGPSVLHLAQDPGMGFATEGWRGPNAGLVAASCSSEHIRLQGELALSMVGTDVEIRQGGTSKTLRLGLEVHPAGLSKKFELTEGILSSSLGAHWSLPGSRAVDLQTISLRLTGSLHIPSFTGSVTWGERTVENPQVALDPEGDFVIDSAGSGRLSVRGDAINPMEKAAIGVGAGAALAAASRKILLGAQALFTRLTQDKALDHPRRRAIVDAITQNPGVHIEQLANGLGLSRRVIDYHCRVLGTQGVILYRKFRGRTALFAPGLQPRSEEEALYQRRVVSVQAVLGVLEERSTASQKELCASTKLSQRRVSKILADLRRLGLVAAEKAGPRTMYRLSARA